MFALQVSVIAFFTAGSMVQLVLSILVSVCAFAYHVHALPYRESWLNCTRGLVFFVSSCPHGVVIRF